MARVLILGGGLAGMGAAHALVRAGVHEVTIVERGSELGGLAGTFESGGRFYPLAYHHILHRDRTLLWFLDRLGALGRVRWRSVRMLFQQEGRLYALARPIDFLRFPMSLADKARFVRLMARSSRKSDWGDWAGRSASELVDSWAGPGVRRALFERLTKLKFGLACDEVSAAWLGARLHQREGSAPLGYVPGANWTKVLCDGLAESLRADGVTVKLGATIRRLAPGATGDAIAAAELDSGERLDADAFVSTVPTEVFTTLVPPGAAPELASIRYTAVVSAICATRQRVEPDFYWLNLTALDSTACGIFRLDALNPTIGAPGEACLNLMTHVPSRHDPFFRRSDAELLAGYAQDFERVLGSRLEPSWWRLMRLPMYSPVFDRAFRNPPVRSARFANLFFAGNYRTFPSVASTGTALHSGLEAAQALLADRGTATDLPEAARNFRLQSMPRA